MKYWPFYIAVGSIITLSIVFVGPGDSNPAGSQNTEATALSPVVYWTEPGLEPDTCVAAWLLTRIVSPGATVEISERSEVGIPFDVADADLSRPSGGSTSSVIIDRFGVDDAFARSVAAVARELEVNPWTTNDEPLFMEVRAGLADALNEGQTDEERMTQCLGFLDRLRASRQLSDTPNHGEDSD